MLFRRALLAALGMSLLYANAAMAAAELVVLPIDRAKFLAGQKFDMEIELRGAQFDEISVKLDGRDAESLFGRTPDVKRRASLSSVRYNEVSLTKLGTVTVDVEAKAGGEVYKKRVVYTVAPPKAPRAKNVILFIGDGMGLQSRQIGRILSKGITQGKYDGLLEMEMMNGGTALITTSGYDSLVTNSANSASAYATGHKSVVNAMGVYENSDPDPLTHPKVENITELVKRVRRMSVGVVTTSNITDATPATMVAHTRRRAELNFIAGEMIKADVVLGGGAQQFLPKSVPGSKRTDERNLIDEFKAKGYAFAGNRSELASANGGKVLGLFNLDNMNVYLDREILRAPDVLNGFGDQPNLVEMTRKAIDILSFKIHSKPVSPAIMSKDAAIANVNRAPRGTLYAGNIPVNESQEVHTADDVPL